jgi:hypothetical protein
MSFDWTEYLELAEFLLSQAGSGCTQEASCRGSASKAYYAAFNYARQYASTYLGFVPRTQVEDRSQDHGRLRAHFIKRRRRRVADTLHTLRDLRNQCDYVDDLSGINLPQAAADALNAARYVIRMSLQTAKSKYSRRSCWYRSGWIGTV